MGNSLRAKNDESIGKFKYRHYLYIINYSQPFLFLMELMKRFTCVTILCQEIFLISITIPVANRKVRAEVICLNLPTP